MPIYQTRPTSYEVAAMSRLLKITGLFCKIALYKRRYSAKETYHFKEPTNFIQLPRRRVRWLRLVGSLKL